MEALNAHSMQTKWDFYHWDETKVNQMGESLRTCMMHYGVGGIYSSEKDMVVALIFLCSEKTAANSWLLGMKHLDNTQAEASLYDTSPRVYHLSPGTSLGAQITELLGSVVFVREE
jgi:hypothetical protein